MKSLQIQIEKGSLCRSIRTKTMFYQSDDPSTADREERGPFWCGRTQGLYGPDGEIAEPEKCKPGRTCCETG